MTTKDSARATGHASPTTRYTDHSALATPNDLPPEARDEVAQALTPLVADAIALYVETKGAHWHVSGPHFRDFHRLLDEQAEQLLATTDSLAERVRKLGLVTVHSLAQAARLTRISEQPDGARPARVLLHHLLVENRQFAAFLRLAHEVSTRRMDVATASLLETILDETEGRIWFLFESVQADAHGE